MTAAGATFSMDAVLAGIAIVVALTLLFDAALVAIGRLATKFWTFP